MRIDGLLAHAAPQRVRALPCFTREETGRLIERIETETTCGRRDYAMVLLAVSTGLRCCDIVALRLEEIDWRRDEIRLVQAKTSRPLVQFSMTVDTGWGRRAFGWGRGFPSQVRGRGTVQERRFPATTR